MPSQQLHVIIVDHTYKLVQDLDNTEKAQKIELLYAIGQETSGTLRFSI